MEKDKEFVVWVLSEVSSEWLGWVKACSVDTLKEAIRIGNMLKGCWGVRKSNDPKPNYIFGDDGRWLDV